MKTINSSQLIAIPEGVTVTVKSRKVVVSGKRGTLTRNFRHQMVDISVVGKKKKMVKVEKWFGKSKELSIIRTICSSITNLFKGVQTGYQYKMRFVYAHFPINAKIAKDGKEFVVDNFLGEKRTRVVPMRGDVKIARSEKVKDEVVLSGSDIDLVAQSAADITVATRIYGKDIRKFLDGIYTSEKGLIE